MARDTDSELYRYPQRLRETLDHLPQAPGVYFFWAAESKVPLYIGKSVNIRSRVFSHLRTVNEARLLRQTDKITFTETAGDIGAQLLEATLIKQLIPLHNKQLRKQRALFSLHWDETKIDIVSSREKNFALTPELYGLYRNKRAAMEFIRNLADEHQLCLATLGIEAQRRGQGCFRSMLGKCRGVCQGKESIVTHHSRAKEALATWQIKMWPYPGRVAIHEQREGFNDYHIIDHWRYINTVNNLTTLPPAATENSFDGDSYRILCRALFNEKIDVITLE
ncbi:endonuclease [Rosenbergiella australiborealis]|uniref:endonuclease n=1 Tax=Rosenbergiella australiborealis TaxID=1544696 RepID=UPI001F4DF180|nr:endonuclease [Rosenbergiella australiborealis]